MKRFEKWKLTVYYEHLIMLLNYSTCTLKYSMNALPTCSLTSEFSRSEWSVVLPLISNKKKFFIKLKNF